MKKNGYIWLSIFIIFFLLGMDFWFWDDEISLSFYGLPGWIYYFIGLQVLFTLTVWVFSKKYWGKEK